MMYPEEEHRTEDNLMSSNMGPYAFPFKIVDTVLNKTHPAGSLHYTITFEDANGLRYVAQHSSFIFELRDEAGHAEFERKKAELQTRYANEMAALRAGEAAARTAAKAGK
jgi:hypothetical protein